MGEDIRRQAISVIQSAKDRSRSELLKALFDLRHNAERGDETMLYPLLEHADDGVVASALYSLYWVHDQKRQLRKTIGRLAWGDPRDVEDMPIQTRAINLLGDYARADPVAHQELERIAECVDIVDVPRKAAWHVLADIHGIEWARADTEEMIARPDSEKSEQIRERIRRAIRGQARAR